MGPPGSALGPLGGLLEVPWEAPGPSEGVPGPSDAVGSRLGGFSVLAWGPLGAPQGRLGGHLGGILGRIGALLGPLWGPLGPAVVGRRRDDNEQSPRSSENLRSNNIAGLFEPSWRSSWRPLGPSGRPLWP
eukprot:5533016-Pyramimonas_sp.AAC.1